MIDPLLRQTCRHRVIVHLAQISMTLDNEADIELTLEEVCHFVWGP
jgi:hypothetical protein